jgi:hypothetical protein
MYRYTVMALSTAVVFGVIYILLDLLFGSVVDWRQVALESIAFGIVMTVIQYYKERNK